MDNVFHVQLCRRGQPMIDALFKNTDDAGAMTQPPRSLGYDYVFLSARPVFASLEDFDQAMSTGGMQSDIERRIIHNALEKLNPLERRLLGVG
jgi:hypothetical protein